MPSANAFVHPNRSISPIIVISTYFAYTYDAASRIVKIGREAGLATYYSYDAASRLIGETWKNSSTTIYAFSYDYDAVGNRTYERRNGVQTYYTYDAVNKLLQSHNVTNNTYTYFAYDLNGNCTSIAEPDGTTYFAYNDSDLVTQITFKSGVTNYFYYDALMRRYAMEDSSGVTYFVWDKDGLNLLAEKNSAGNVTAEYIHGYSPIAGIGTMVAAKKMVGTTAYYQYPHYDHRGSVCTLTDKSGTVVASYLYDAWGNILNSTESVATQVVGNRFKYQSNWMTLKDSGGKICLSPTRLYVPGIGRFLQRDPLENPSFQNHAYILSSQTSEDADEAAEYEEGSSRYSYCKNNPLLYVDPNGEWVVVVLRILAFILALLAKAAARQKARELAKKIAECEAIYLAYKASGKLGEGCKPCMSASEYTAKIAGLTAEVAGRALYLSKKCDYYLPDSIARGSAKAEAGHRLQATQKAANLAKCTGYAAAAALKP